MYNIYGDPSLTNVTFSGNTAVASYGRGSLGGGMYNSSNPTLTNVTFEGNDASSGGGMFNSSGSPTLTNVTFEGNDALSGGGMYNSSSSPTLTNVTFSRNSVFTAGGGMLNNSSSNPQIRNTIFWGNTAGAIVPPGTAQIGNLNSSTSYLSFNVVQGGCPPGSVCTNLITADPQLGLFGDYGGFTQTIPLLPGSSAIDTGNATYCPATDQRGVSRPQGAGCDIGAYEAVLIQDEYTIFLPLVIK